MFVADLSVPFRTFKNLNKNILSPVFQFLFAILQIEKKFLLLQIEKNFFCYKLLQKIPSLLKIVGPNRLSRLTFIIHKPTDRHPNNSNIYINIFY